MAKAKDITIKSTKNELLDAYNELLNVVEAKESPEKTSEARKREDSASQKKQLLGLTPEKIINSLADLKVDTAGFVEQLETKMLQQYKKMTDMERVICEQQNEIEELQNIKTNINTLEALILAQKEKGQAFEVEMAEKKSQFDKQMALQAEEQKDYESRLKTQRTREQEDYQYQLTMKRKKEQDEYLATSQQREKSLQERESAVALAESQFGELREQVSEFPARIERAVQEARDALVKELTMAHEHRILLREKEIEGQTLLSQQIIKQLEAKIKEQDMTLKELTTRSNDAVKQVQNMALKAIEGVSTQRGNALSARQEE